MPECTSVQSSVITSDERIRNVLRRHIQKAYDVRAFTREGLAQESKVNVYQIDQIISRDPAKQRRVSAEDALCLAYTLGDEAVSALIGTINYTASRPDTETMGPMMMAATAMSGLSVIATAAADGRIDHTEAPACREAADMIIATMMPLSSAAKEA